MSFFPFSFRAVGWFLFAAFLLAAGVFGWRTWMVLGRTPRGARLARCQASPQWKDGAFRAPEPTRLMATGDDARRGGRGAMKDILFGNPALRLAPEEPIEVVRTDLRALPRGRDGLVWFGHSSYFLQLGGVRYLVDPVFGRASPLPVGGKPFPATYRYSVRDLPDIHVVVLTHDHYDHLEWPTIRFLKDKVPRFVCPLGVGEHLEKWGVPAEKIVELDWEESDEASGLTALPARHFSGRTFRRNQSLWASYLLEAGGMRIFLGGDSGYGKHFAAIGSEHGPIDLAILENGQYNDAWPFVHCRPNELARVVRDLGCRAFLTVHHGKYILSRHPWDEPWANERAAAAESGVPLLSAKMGEFLPLRLPKEGKANFCLPAPALPQTRMRACGKPPGGLSSGNTRFDETNPKKRS